MSKLQDFFNQGNYRYNWNSPESAFLNIFGSLGNMFGSNVADKTSGFADWMYQQGGNDSMLNSGYNPDQPRGLLGSMGLFGQQSFQRPTATQPPQMSQTGQQASQGANSYGVDLMTRDYTNPFQQRQAAWEKLRNAR